jgi:hypothetical protein
MDPSRIDHPKAMLRVARVQWAALVAGPVLFGSVVAFVTNREPKGHSEIGQDTADLLFYVALGLCAVQIPLAIFIRGQALKSGWVGDVVTPMAYLRGNLIAWALCEGVVFFGLVICLLSGSMWPYVTPAVVSLAGLILLWPNGRAMFPPRDRYAVGER